MTVSPTARLGDAQIEMLFLQLDADGDGQIRCAS